MKVGLFVTYHDACSGLRELGVKAQPRALLARLRGVALTEMNGADAVVLGDLGCMLNIEGRQRRMGDETTRVLHIAEILAGEP